MTQTISLLGGVHTAISLIPIVAGIYSFIRFSKIDTDTQSGKVYVVGLVLSVVSSLGVSHTGGLNPAHAFGLIVLLVAFGGVLVTKVAFLGVLRPYLSVFLLSFSFFLSLVPGVNETLTRVPFSQPLADAPMSPVILHTLMVLLGLFILGVTAQCWMIFSRNRNEVLT